MKKNILFLLLIPALLLAADLGPLTRVNHLAVTVAAPSVLTVTNGAQTVFTNFAGKVLDGRVLIRTLQNTGTTPILYAINATVTTNAYHGVLAGGNAARDGLGSMVDLSKVPFAVTVLCETTGTVAVVEMRQ